MKPHPSLEYGVIGEAVTPDGRMAVLVRLLLGQVKIVVGPVGAQTYTDEWMYADLGAALHAFRAWDGAPGTEPDGWLRHARAGEADFRRRPDGDPAREYRAP